MVDYVSEEGRTLETRNVCHKPSIMYGHWEAELI